MLPLRIFELNVVQYRTTCMASELFYVECCVFCTEARKEKWKSEGIGMAFESNRDGITNDCVIKESVYGGQLVAS